MDLLRSNAPRDNIRSPGTAIAGAIIILTIDSSGTVKVKARDNDRTLAYPLLSGALMSRVFPRRGNLGMYNYSQTRAIRSTRRQDRIARFHWPARPVIRRRRAVKGGYRPASCSDVTPEAALGAKCTSLPRLSQFVCTNNPSAEYYSNQYRNDAFSLAPA